MKAQELDKIVAASNPLRSKQSEGLSLDPFIAKPWEFEHAGFRQRIFRTRFSKASFIKDASSPILELAVTCYPPSREEFTEYFKKVYSTDPPESLLMKVDKWRICRYKVPMEIPPTDDWVTTKSVSTNTLIGTSTQTSEDFTSLDIEQLSQ